MSETRSQKIIATDFLVVGTGVAGLTYAIKTAEACPSKKVLVITKSEVLESNTRHAQGGIAVVTNKLSDSFEKHINDTLVAGAGLCNEKVVRTVVTEGPERIKEVMDWGTRFDTLSGTISLGKEGGHSENRIVHVGDKTGKKLSDVLLKRVAALKNVSLLKGQMAIDLITSPSSNERDKECSGVSTVDNMGNSLSILSGNTILATGGIGQVYACTTNPEIATGDGIGMAIRAEAEISGMEFIQFHPTALSHDLLDAPFLISEAVRGAGAKLKNSFGEYFMERYHEQKDLAPRDIVSRAVFAEMKKTSSNHVFLDCTSISTDELERHFPTISKTCSNLGLNLKKDLIPVRPAAHYLCGGIGTDLDAQTSIKNLYAIGECANTGLHGGNRLASNSLLEALVMAHRCSISTSKNSSINSLSTSTAAPKIGIDPCSELRTELRSLMESQAGIIRTTDNLNSALIKLNEMSEIVENKFRSDSLSIEGLELRNMISTSLLIIRYSLERKSNVGGFYNSDFEENQLSDANHSAKLVGVSVNLRE